MLNPDTLVERAKLKSQVTLWRALTFIVLIITVFALLGGGVMSKIKNREDYIARINVDNIIFEDQERTDILTEIENDKKIKAVILKINSPGGSGVGGEELYNALKQLNSKKPVVAVMDSLAASAAYLISLGCERTFAHNGTITGSIGVIMEVPNVKDMADKVGFRMDYVKTSPLKGAPDIFSAKDEQAFAVLKGMMDDFYKYFVNLVSVERNIPLETAFKLADGRVFSAKQALDNKLIDEIGGEKDAQAWLIKNKGVSKDLEIKEVKLNKPKAPFEEFLGSLSKNFSIKALTDKIFDLKGLLL